MIRASHPSGLRPCSNNLVNRPLADLAPESYRCHARVQVFFSNLMVFNQPLCGSRHGRIRCKPFFFGTRRPPIKPSGLCGQPLIWFTAGSKLIIERPFSHQTSFDPSSCKKLPAPVCWPMPWLLWRRWFLLFFVDKMRWPPDKNE